MSCISNEEADYGYSQYQDFKMQQEELGYYDGEQQGGEGVKGIILIS